MLKRVKDSFEKDDMTLLPSVEGRRKVYTTQVIANAPLKQRTEREDDGATQGISLS